MTGYANVVVELHKYFAASGISTTFISTVPNLVAVLFPGKAWKLLRILHLAWLTSLCAASIPFHRGVYISLNGGIGLLFDLACVATARVFGKRILLHHHSFSYLNSRSSLAGLIFDVAGVSATHVVNCEAMQRRLQSLYNSARSVCVVSNAGILVHGSPDRFSPATGKATGQEVSVPPKSMPEPLLKVGFMAYFNREKGLDTFCEVVRKLEQANVKVAGVAVGPVHDAELTGRLKQRYGDTVEFRGPAYGEARDKFFAEIDVLLFPSRYANEAEPLTIYHALAAGVPVVTTEVGCLRDMTAGVDSCLSISSDNFVEKATAHLQILAVGHPGRNNRRRAVEADWSLANQKALHQLQLLLKAVRA